jgi:hypothetical protein
MLEADLQNAKELFGDFSVEDKKPVLNFVDMKPQSKTDFEGYTVALSEHLAPFKVHGSFYSFYSVQCFLSFLCGKFDPRLV